MTNKDTAEGFDQIVDFAKTVITIVNRASWDTSKGLQDEDYPDMLKFDDDEDNLTFLKQLT